MNRQTASYRPETITVHSRGAADLSGAGNPVIPADVRSTVFFHPEPGLSAEYQYTRNENPNRDRLETTIASLEQGSDCAVFASGMAAVAAVFGCLPPESTVVIPDDVYHGTRTFLTRFAERLRLNVHTIDMEAKSRNGQDSIADSLARVARTTGSVDLVWVETPSNPLLKISDISFLAKQAHSFGALLCVDNTWASPMNQQPFALGADLIVHSATKYLGGHSDILAGAVVGNGDGAVFERIRDTQRMAGSVLSAHDCWMLTRSIKTLALRMHAHNSNASMLAPMLLSHPKVKTVYYPGLPGHPGHEVARAQMTGYGGMISFELATSEQAARQFVHETQLIAAATSLGGVESTWEHRRSVEGPASSTPPTLIRLSVGIEHIDDLAADITQALRTLPA